MASRIKGITVEIGGDTTGLASALRGVDSQIKTTQSNLKDVNRLLKLDPSNTILLSQKQKDLESAIGLTKTRLEELKRAQAGVEQGSEQWDALKREIIETEQNLQALEREYKTFGSVAKQQLQAVGTKLKEVGGKIEEAGRKLSGISGTATAVGGGLLKLGYDAVTSADDLNTLSKQTGLSTSELQKMKYASDLIDVSLEDITGALRKFKSKVDPSNDSLAKLGVTTTNADGSLRDATDVFYDTLEALSKVSNETERDQLAMSLFGKSADSLAGIIDDGGAALKAYGHQAEELGVILDQETLDALNDTNDTIDKLKSNLVGTMAQIGANVASVLGPALKKGAALIEKITEKLRALTPEQTETILKTVGIVAAVAPALIVGGKLVSSLGSIISAVGAVVGVLGGPLTLAIAAVIAIGVLLWKNWDTVKATALSLKNTVSSAFEDVKTRAVNSWNNITTTVSNAVNTLKTNVTTAFNTVKSTVSTAVEGIKTQIDSMKTTFNNIKTTVTNALAKIKEVFTFNWQLPKIKLPHFKIKGGTAPYGLGGLGEFPSVSISWYKKAYTDPVIFKTPTVLSTPSGYKGFGDGSGAEIVMGLNKLQELVGSTGNVTINVYASQDMDINRLADKIQQRFIALNRQRRLSNA